MILALVWLAITKPPGTPGYAIAVIALLTAFISWIAFRTLVLAVREQLFPARLPADSCPKFQICTVWDGSQPLAEIVHIGLFGSDRHLPVCRSVAERGNQGGDALELIALGVEVKGAEADNDVARSGRDVAAEALDDALGGAGDDRLDLLQFLQRHAVVGDGVVIERPATAVEAAVDSYGHE